jgi:hypothetical protein
MIYYRLTFLLLRVPFFSPPLSLPSTTPSAFRFALIPVPLLTLTIAFPPPATCASAAAQSADALSIAYLYTAHHPESKGDQGKPRSEVDAG